MDDDTDARDVAAASLQSLGIAVELADTSAAGLRIVSDWRPDVIVADIGMPGEDGYHFVRQLRALGADRGGLTPAIALTAYSRPEDRRRRSRPGSATTSRSRRYRTCSRLPSRAPPGEQQRRAPPATAR